MSWRTLLITQRAKLTYKNNSLIVIGDETRSIHLSEINTIVIDTLQVSITGYLLAELHQRKIKLITCDERHNPQAEFVPYYGSYNTSKRIQQQIAWIPEYKREVWAEIVRAKITNQARALRTFDSQRASQVIAFARDVLPGDRTNREGHAAKVYFNSMFGNEFTREQDRSLNAALNYGYAVLLSSFNREIVSRGYLTQLGVHHRGEYNEFNFGCDLVEPFRPLVDALARRDPDRPFDQEYRTELVGILSEKVRIGNGSYYLSNAIPMYVESVLRALESGSVEEIEHYEL